MSRSLKVRPCFTGILKTSKYPGETVIHPPPPWNGPWLSAASGRPTMRKGRP